MTRSRLAFVVAAQIFLLGCSSEGDAALCTRIAETGRPLRSVQQNAIVASGYVPAGADLLDIELFQSADDGVLKGLVAARNIEGAIDRCREIGALR